MDMKGLNHLFFSVFLVVVCSCDRSNQPYSTIIKDIIVSKEKESLLIDIQDSTLFLQTKSNTVEQNKDSLIILVQSLIRDREIQNSNREEGFDVFISPFSKFANGLNTEEAKDFHILDYQLKEEKTDIHGYVLTSVEIKDLYFRLFDEVYFIEYLATVLMTEKEWRVLDYPYQFILTNVKAEYLKDLNEKELILKQLLDFNQSNPFWYYRDDFNVETIRKFYQNSGKTLTKAFFTLSNNSVHRIDSIYYEAIIKSKRDLILSKHAWLSINLEVGEIETFEIDQFKNQFLGAVLDNQSDWDFYIKIQDFEPKESLLNEIEELRESIQKIRNKLDSINVVIVNSN